MLSPPCQTDLYRLANWLLQPHIFKESLWLSPGATGVNFERWIVFRLDESEDEANYLAVERGFFPAKVNHDTKN